MAERARDAAARIASTEPGYAIVLARLEDCLQRADAFAVEGVGASRGWQGATTRLTAIRRDLQQHQLKHLMVVARLAGKEDPTVRGVFRLPNRHAAMIAFRAEANGLLARAEERREQLTALGYGQSSLDALTSALTALDRFIMESNNHRATQIRATTSVELLAGEMVQLVAVLDAIIRAQFGDDAETIARWDSASHVERHAGHQKAAPEPEAEPEAVPVEAAAKVPWLGWGRGRPSS